MALPYMSFMAFPEHELDIELATIEEIARESFSRRLGVSIGQCEYSSNSVQPMMMPFGLQADIQFDHSVVRNQWQLSTKGDFASKTTFYEFDSNEDGVSGPARILQVIDALEYISKLYSNSGVSSSENIKFRFGWHGIDGTSLSRRNIDVFFLSHEYTTIAHEVYAPDENNYFTEPLWSIKENIVAITTRIVQKLFLMYKLTITENICEKWYLYYRTGNLS